MSETTVLTIKAVFPTLAQIYCFISMNQSFGQIKYGPEVQSSQMRYEMAILQQGFCR